MNGASASVFVRTIVWWRRLGVMIWKELLQLSRDPALVLFLSYAFTLDIYLAASGVSLELKNADLWVYDGDHTFASRELIHRFRSPWFNFKGELTDAGQGMRYLDRGEAMAVLDIPPRFQEALARGEQVGVQLLIDTTNSPQGLLASSYAARIVGDFALSRAPDRLPLVRSDHRVWYNPNQEESWFQAISDVLTITTVFAVLLPGAAMAREKERGTIEQLLVTPLSPFQVMFPKVVAMTVVVLTGTSISLFGILRPIFHVPFRGNLILYFVLTALYVFTIAGLGLFAATLARNQAQVGLMSILLVAPMVQLSGTWTPLEAMPDWLRYTMQLSPLHYFLNITTASSSKESDCRCFGIRSWRWPFSAERSSASACGGSGGSSNRRRMNRGLLMRNSKQRRKLQLGVAVVALLLCVALPAAADDKQEKSGFGSVASVPAGEVINGDYFAIGRAVEISGTVNGDVYAAGGTVLVDGVVNGDVLASGGTVTVSGAIAQDARIMGGRITVSGTIGRGATIVGGDVNVTPSATIEGGMVSGAGNLHLGGPVGRDVRIGAGNVTVSNKIGGDLAVAARAIRLTSKATIGGNIRYWSDTEPSIDERAKVAGTIRSESLPQTLQPGQARRAFAGFRVFVMIASFISTLIIGLLFARIYPSFSRAAVEALRQRPSASLGWGTAVFVGTPVVAALLMATLVGIPLGLLLFALYLVGVYLVRVFVMAWVGTLLFDRSGRSLYTDWSFIAGLVLYFVPTLIPVVGGLLTLSVILFGLGAAALAKKELYVGGQQDAESLGRADAKR